MRLADKRAHQPGLKTILDSRREFLDRPLPDAHSIRRSSLARISPYPLPCSNSSRLSTQGAPHFLQLTGGRSVRAKTVVIASGARYRRPKVQNIDTFEGAGVSYWATPVEARLCQGEEIALIGGGNSAGQAVAYLAPQVGKLHLVVRRPLEETMSRYLIDHIAALSNVVHHVGCEIASVSGNDRYGTVRRCPA